MSGCTKTTFGWSCQISEDAMFIRAMEGYEEERLDQERTENMAERLIGDCERCQEACDTGLTVVGGAAVCDPCLEAEVSRDP